RRGEGDFSLWTAVQPGCSTWSRSTLLLPDCFGERGELVHPTWGAGRRGGGGGLPLPPEGQGLGSDEERSQGQGKLPSVGRKKPMGVCL
ncbi:unnamed protein product, partial [Gulo gulo]